MAGVFVALHQNLDVILLMVQKSIELYLFNPSFQNFSAFYLPKCGFKPRRISLILLLLVPNKYLTHQKSASKNKKHPSSSWWFFTTQLKNMSSRQIGS